MVFRSACSGALLLLATTVQAMRVTQSFSPASATLTAAAAGLRAAPKSGVLASNMCLRGGAGGIQSLVSREVRYGPRLLTRSSPVVF